MPATVADYRTDFTDHPSPEGKYRAITFLLKDGKGNRIPAANLDSLVLTLYDEPTGTIINARTAQTVLNANGGTYTGDATTAAGEMALGPSDMAMVDATLSLEVHVLLFEFAWDGDVDKKGAHRIRLAVANEVKLP